MNVQLGDETNSGTLDVPYLVTSGEIEFLIHGFNAIREIVNINNNTEMLKKIFKNVFNSTDPQKIDSLKHFIAAKEEAQTCVKIKGKDIVAPAGKVLHVQYKADVGFLEWKTPMMFQQLEIELPEGTGAVDSEVIIRKCINYYFQVPVVNESKHDIVLNTNVGVIDYCKSVIPLQVNSSTSCKSLSVSKTTVTPLNQMLEELSITPPNKINSEHQQRVVNTADLSELTTT